MPTYTRAMLLILLPRFIQSLLMKAITRGKHTSPMPHRAVFKRIVTDVNLDRGRLEVAPFVAF